jgi:isochorismate pyruvate lyase
VGVSAPEAVLAPLRAKIDAVDSALVSLLAERMALVRAVVEEKARVGLPARLDGRVEEVVAHVREQAEAAGCPPHLAETVWRTMIEWIIGFEEHHLSPSAPARASRGPGS